MGRSRDSEVGLRFTATDRATSTIENVRKNLAGLDGAAGLATKGLAGLAGAFGAGMILQFGREVAGAVTEMAQLAAQSEMVAGSMQGLAASFGQSGDAMLDALKRASNGTIAEYDLMLGANKAMMLGVATNADQLEAIMKVALSRGAAMGLSTTQAFDNLVTGLGRGSALILDNLGITMQSLQAAEAEYAAAIGKTTDELSDQEKKQGMVNAVLKEAATVDMSNVSGMASSFAQAQAAIADMKAALGELFGPAIEAVATTLRDAVVSSKEIIDTLNAPTLAEQTRAAADEYARAGDMLEAGGGAAETLLQLQQAQNALLEEEITLRDLRNQKQRELINAQADLRRMESSPDALFQELTAQEQLIGRLQGELAALDSTGINNAAMQRELGVAIGSTNQIIAAQAAALEAWMIPGTERWNAYVQAMAAAGPAMATAVAGVGRAAGATNDVLNSLTGGLQSSASASQLWAQYVNAAGRNSEGLRTAAGAAALEVQKLGSAAGGAVGGLAAINAEAINAANALYALEHAAEQAAAAATSSAINAVRASSMQAASTLGVSEALRTYDEQAQTLRQTGAYLAKAGLSQTEIDFAMAAMTDRMTGATMDRVSAIQAEATALTTASGGAQSYAQSLFDASVAGVNFSTSLDGLQGQVQSALSGVFDVGVDPADFMPRPDAINENARRLADIMVNGFKDQSWLEEFKAEAPDIYAALTEAQDPQAAAAAMLQQFQAGLLPGLIDKEAVKEKVKMAILGDANMSALASEITAELAAEMGQNPAEVAGLVNQAMGRTAGDTSSGDMQTAVISQLKSANFITAVQSAAGNAGSKWGDGFLSQVAGNVPEALVELLATLIAPRVREKNKQEDQRTGAE